ncbi:unnamed protein product [Moneuplotes crassus]|uniref:Uncharacterized protein n=1 Tax=Euplotes crassus TaxID=5936 RepID=A0AAD1XHS0_EUPCR|nr:unnamed protein product [Moneuplotes crassus]
MKLNNWRKRRSQSEKAISQRRNTQQVAREECKTRKTADQDSLKLTYKTPERKQWVKSTKLASDFKQTRVIQNYTSASKRVKTYKHNSHNPRMKLCNLRERRNCVKHKKEEANTTIYGEDLDSKIKEIEDISLQYKERHNQTEKKNPERLGTISENEKAEENCQSGTEKFSHSLSSRRFDNDINIYADKMKNSCLIDYSVYSDENLTPLTRFEGQEEGKRTGRFLENQSRKSVDNNSSDSFESNNDDFIHENVDFVKLKESREALHKIQLELNENKCLSGPEKSSLSNQFDYIMQILSSRITEKNLERTLPEFRKNERTRTERKNTSVLDMDYQVLRNSIKKKRYML